MFVIMRIALKKIFFSKQDAAAWLSANLLRIAADILVITIFFTATPLLQGYSLLECVLLYGVFTNSAALFYMFFAWTTYFSNLYIIKKELLIVKKLPVNPFVYICGSNTAPSEIPNVVYGLIIIATASCVLKLNIALLLGVFAISLLGVAGVAALFTIVAALSIRWPKLDVAFSPFMSVLEYAQLPISVYPQFVRKLLTWIIPIVLIAFGPISIMLKTGFVDISIWYLFFPPCCFVLAVIIFNFACRHADI